VGAAVARHWPLFGSCFTLLAFVLAKRALNGGSLPIAGRYAVVGRSNARPLHVLELAFQHLVELDFALGVVPFAGALVATYALARFRFPVRQLAYGAVAASVTFWLLLEVAYDAAAFDVAGSPFGTPRIHERYLVYLMPLFLVAFVAALRAVRPRVSPLVLIAVAAVSALLPAAIPFSRAINDTIPVDSFGLQIFATGVHGNSRPIPNAALVSVVIAAVCALAFLYGLLRPRPRVAVAMTALYLFMSSGLLYLIHTGMRLTGENAAADTAARSAWVDAAAKGHPVTLVAGPRDQRDVLRLTAFHNLSVTHISTTCATAFGSDFGERLLTLRHGVLMDGPAPVRASYVLAPIDLRIRGRVVAMQPKERLVLLAPAGGTLRVARPFRCPS
jgi:hypothetical protein